MALPLLAIPYAAEMASFAVFAVIAKLSIKTVGDELNEQVKSPAGALAFAGLAAVGTYYAVRTLAKNKG